MIGCAKKANPECNCCVVTYSNISDAEKCIKENPSETPSDNRLFLLAFSKSDVQGWNSITDPEVISVAKRKYLLIHLKNTESEFLKEKATPELLEVVKKHKSEKLFFVIVNQALYPFADWNDKEQKEVIIDRLGIGNGP
ncbi:MAG: hypothetical protein Aureis2KO_08310 [Aureisphaera sp.]